VPDLKLNEISDARERQAGQNGHLRPLSRLPGDPAAAAALRAAAASATPRALWRYHRLFTILLTLSLVPRVLAALAFRPAMLTSDSFLYMNEAAKGTLGQIRPSGYSWFLDIFRPLPHTLLAVTTVQHLMGIAIAAIVYGMLRYWGLPAWGACLAAAPTLFDTRQIALESYILPDTLYTLMLLIATALLLTRRTPRLWQCLLAGLLVAYVSVLRGNGLPLAVLFAIFILIRRVGWRAFTAAAVAFAVPLLAYVIAFHASYGKYNLTNSDGIFLWSRTTSFANCAIIKPPAQLRPLCPNLEKSVAPPPAPAWSINGTLNEPTPADYLWAPDVWWRNDKYPGINKYNNKLGLHFAIQAIEAQPLDYLRVTGRDVMLVFLSNDRPIAQSTMSFTITPHIAKLPYYYANDEYQYAGIRGNTYFVQPYAYFLFLYQLPVYFPGIVFFLVVVAGLVGVIRRWRGQGRLAALPWALAATSIVLPAMLTQSLYRYTLVAVPLACIAAGMAFLRPEPKLEPAASQAGIAPVPAADASSAAGADITALPAPAEPASAEPAPPGAARADAADAADAADVGDVTDGSRPGDPARADPPESDGPASGNGSSPAGPADVPET
jgi:hypothetical protein